MAVSQRPATPRPSRTTPPYPGWVGVDKDHRVRGEPDYPGIARRWLRHDRDSAVGRGKPPAGRIGKHPGERLADMRPAARQFMIVVVCQSARLRIDHDHESERPANDRMPVLSGFGVASSGYGHLWRALAVGGEAGEGLAD